MKEVRPTDIARPYARAVFELGVRESNLSEWSDSFSYLSELVRHPKIRILLAMPRRSPDEKAELLLYICAEGVSDAARRLVHVLAEHRRLDCIEAIAKNFEARRAQYEQRIPVAVVSAFPLSKEQREMIRGRLCLRFAATVELSESVDASLIGGAVLRMGDLVIDGSIRARLRRLKQMLL